LSISSDGTDIEKEENEKRLTPAEPEAEDVAVAEVVAAVAPVVVAAPLAPPEEVVTPASVAVPLVVALEAAIGVASSPHPSAAAATLSP